MVGGWLSVEHSVEDALPASLAEIAGRPVFGESVCFLFGEVGTVHFAFVFNPFTDGIHVVRFGSAHCADGHVFDGGFCYGRGGHGILFLVGETLLLWPEGAPVGKIGRDAEVGVLDVRDGENVRLDSLPLAESLVCVGLLAGGESVDELLVVGVNDVVLVVPVDDVGLDGWCGLVHGDTSR